MKKLFLASLLFMTVLCYSQHTIVNSSTYLTITNGTKLTIIQKPFSCKPEPGDVFISDLFGSQELMKTALLTGWSFTSSQDLANQINALNGVVFSDSPVNDTVYGRKNNSWYSLSNDFLKKDGTIPLSDNWDVGFFNITHIGTLGSAVHAISVDNDQPYTSTIDNCHLFLYNPNAAGQTNLLFNINNNMAAKFRVDYTKNLYIIGGEGGGINFAVNGDLGDGGTEAAHIDDNGTFFFDTYFINSNSINSGNRWLTDSGGNNSIQWEDRQLESSDESTSIDYYNTTEVRILKNANMVQVLNNGSFANNAAAISGGLTAGQVYYTDVAGEYILKIVH